MSQEFTTYLAIAAIFSFVVFFICLYIFRAIFNIPSFLRMQKAQIRLLEEMAKQQGVDSQAVGTIVSEAKWERWENS